MSPSGEAWLITKILSQLQQGCGLGAIQHGLSLLAGGGLVPGLFRLQLVEQLGDVGAVLNGIGGLEDQLGHMAQGEALSQLPADEPAADSGPARRFGAL